MGKVSMNPDDYVWAVEIKDGMTGVFFARRGYRGILCERRMFEDRRQHVLFHISQGLFSVLAKARRKGKIRCRLYIKLLLGDLYYEIPAGPFKRPLKKSRSRKKSKGV